MSEPSAVEWRLAPPESMEGRHYIATHRGIRYSVYVAPPDAESEEWLLDADVADQDVETLLLEEEPEHKPLEPVPCPSVEVAFRRAEQWIEDVSQRYYDLRERALGRLES